jgi:transposase
MAPASRLRRGPSAVAIKLAADERAALERVERTSTAAQRDVLRASIVLLAANGHANRDIAEMLGVEENTVGKWRRRFAKRRIAGLSDEPRSGRPPKFTARQKVRVIKKATQHPRRSGVPFSHWDSVSLARLAIDAGITESIHPTTVWRWLNDADLKPHRVQYWLQSPDPDFEERSQDVIKTYLAAPQRAKQGVATFSVDEKTSIQARERVRPDLLMIPGIPQRIEHEYIRHGTLCLTAALNVATGDVQGLITDDRPAPIFARFLEDLIESVPDAKKIHVVLDNLNTHWHHDACRVVAAASDMDYDPDRFKTGPPRRKFLMSARKRVVFHFTPKHASWLNQIEIWFSVLCRKLLRRESFSSLRELRAALRRFISYYNRHLAHPYRWTYTGTPCRA